MGAAVSQGITVSSRASNQLPFWMLRAPEAAAPVCGVAAAIWYHLSLFLDDAELGEAYATVSTASALNGLVGGPIAALFLSFDGLLRLSGWQW